MTPTTETQPRRYRIARACTQLALIIGIVSAAAALLAGPAYRLGVLDLGAGIQTIRWATGAALAGAVLALLAAAMGLGAAGRRGAAWAALALAVNICVATPPLVMYRAAQTLPRIHDVSTDTADPATFVAVLKSRQGARNPTEYSRDTAALQQRAYPDIAPLHLDLPPAQAFARAEQAVHELGWALVAAAPGDLRIEATDTSLLFGFKDDIVIRIRPDGSGSRVDVRSLSRVGGSDFGVNAKRVRAFLGRMGQGTRP